MLTKDGVRPGDALVLTKPLGMGVTTTALKRGQADPSDVDQAVRWMTQLNAAAAEISHELQIDAATDVTGFSLLGHASEMMVASNVGLEFFLPSIPFLASARKYAEGANFPGGSADNKLFFEKSIDFDDDIDEYNRMLLFDAQTSGGLLCSIPPSRVKAFLGRMEEKGESAWVIGRAFQGDRIIVRAKADQELEKHLAGDEELWYAA
jgi:selenide,water dikinase